MARTLCMCPVFSCSTAANFHSSHKFHLIDYMFYLFILKTFSNLNYFMILRFTMETKFL